MANSYVTTLDTSLAERLIPDLESQGFAIGKAPYALFCAKKKGLSVTLYESGKLVVQGKEMADFVQFYLEPQILQTFQLGYKHLQVDRTARIGVDESGKGDFFGPLSVAAVFVGADEFDELLSMGVADSKTLNDKQAHTLARKIENSFPTQVVLITPTRYNELYKKFGNLNHLLAWAHATAIGELAKETNCRNVLVDQFANERVVQNALDKKGLSLNLSQRPRAEEDPVVAAASIVARHRFLQSLEKLGKDVGITLPKGASDKVLRVGRQLVAEQGVGVLPSVCKAHFRTYQQVVGG